MNPNSDDFKKELKNILESARDSNKEYIEVNSGELHRRVGNYPSNNHRMPLCCSVMKSMMKAGDKILNQPSSGQGASVVIKYFL